MGANSELARRWFNEVWCEHCTDAIDKMMSADAYFYGTGPGEPMGREAFKQFHRLFCTAVPDLRIKLVQVIEQGEWVAFHAHVSGTHAATGCEIRFQGSGLGRVENGLIVEGHNSWDFLSYVIQIGAVPADAVAAALGGG